MEKREIAVNIPQDLDPVYSNRIQVAFKDDEFTFVFMHEIPGTNQARAKSIVSISPKHAKNFSEVLANTVKGYEEKFGEIAAPKGGNDKREFDDKNVTIKGYS